MPVLRDVRNTKEITLKAYPESVVVIYDSVLFSDSHIVEQIGGGNRETEVVAKGLCAFIKSWNFTDDQSNPLDISPENIKKLSPHAVAEISDAIASFIQEKKSVSSAS
jgi:hypothetical protein